MHKDEQIEESSTFSDMDLADPVINANKTNAIVDSIDELEELIAETKLPPKLQPGIPVLNDFVDAAEARGYVEAKSMTSSANTSTKGTKDLSSEKLDELVNIVDQKLSNELGSIVSTLKDNIIDELKQELKKEAGEIRLFPTNINNQEKSSE